LHIVEGGIILENTSIYSEIATRTDGDIYIGVVGPVRTGKSTFIKRFMNELVIPNIPNEYKRERAIDELPQSAQGRTIMTTEPKFVPNEAVKVELDDNASFRVRLVDCVGYIVPNAMGHIENNSPRMVQTPWSDAPLPFEQAAEIGTRKVINDHSTIGLVITTDGSITDLDRSDYVQAEERVISELKAINKPFIVILNTTTPGAVHVKELQEELEEKYGVPVMPLACTDIGEKEINEVIERVLYEFPLSEVAVNMPAWFYSLNNDHWLLNSVVETAINATDGVSKIREAKLAISKLNENVNVARTEISSINLGDGTVAISVILNDDMFYKILAETTGVEVQDENMLLSLFFDYSKVKREYEKIASALQEVQQKGYGIVSPGIDELVLEEPEIVKQGNRYGVRLRASAPSIHMIRADIETEVNPIVGTEKQSEELVTYLLKEFNDEPTKIWDSNIFGKSLHSLVNEGLHNKLDRMPDEAQFKLQETLTKIINEGSGGLICIIL
jgi:stage IV sporulation protein A